MGIKPTTIYVCPTSHLDWDWMTDFEHYFSIGSDYSGCPSNAVRYTFAQMFDLLEQNAGGFAFALAEMGYFRRYLLDCPQAVSQIRKAGAALSLMGGGITSPDNLLSHGEAFIRNYLLGAQWLDSLQLGTSRAPLAWLPDDFGHDPQLPVTLAAMGMAAVGLSRVPGSVQGSPNAKPLDGSPTVAERLDSQEGLVFPWTAADGSTVLCHFMPDTYAVATGDLAGFVTEYSTSVWGGPNMFVPVPSGDFATPTGDILLSVQTYNSDPVDGVTARIGGFADFVDAVLADPSGLTTAPFTLRAANYWTGQFASRPQLKIDHYAAVRHLLAAEAMVGLVTAASTLARAVLDAINRSLEAVWWSLCATTHHDFITGTAPDQTYYLEQLPLSGQNRAQAQALSDRALDLLAGSVMPRPEAAETPLLVFNSLGFARSGLVSLPPGRQGGALGTVRLSGQTGSVTTQRGADGSLLFVATDLPSFGYLTAYLSPGTPAAASPPGLDTPPVFDNGVIRVTFADRSQGYAIASIVDVATNAELVKTGSLACQLVVFLDDGNLYQFGNELSSGGGVGAFSRQFALTRVAAAKVTEYGPVRWRFEVELICDEKTGSDRYEVSYTLVAGESFLRIAVEGRAPSLVVDGVATPNSSAVVAVFPLVDPDGNWPDGLAHGTPNHWDDVEPVRYWEGPTFQATHDFVLPTARGTPFAAIYHGGVPAWCRNQGDGASDPLANALFGTLLRSADGEQRSAAGTDGDVHSLEFAVGVPGGAGLDPSSCTPLIRGTSFATPLLTRAIERMPVGASPTPRQTLGESLSLAGIASGNAVLRAARPQMGSGGKPAPADETSTQSPFGLALRLYCPLAAQALAGASITLAAPAIDPDGLTASIVTALELPVAPDPFRPAVTTITAQSGNSFTVAPAAALSTLRLSGIRPYVAPSAGK